MRKIVLLLALLCPASLFAQGGSVSGGGITVFGPTGKPLAGATVTICAFGATGIPCSPTITVYTSPALSTPASNPATSDGNGNVFVYAAPGQYTYTVTGTGITGASFTATVAGSGGGDVTTTTPQTISGAKTFTGGLIIGTTAYSTTSAGTHSGAETFANINTMLYVGGPVPQVGGSADIGAQINAAYALLPSSGGKLFLLPQTGGGCYNYSTPVVLNTSGKYVSIEGLFTGNQTGGGNQGVCLNYTPTTATTAFTIDYTPAGGGGFVGHPALKNVILSNNGCITVGGCGSSATGLILGSSNGAHFATLDNVRVSGFGTNYSLGVSNGWGILFNQASSIFGGTGLTTTAIMENIRWHGGTISENGTGISCPNSSGLTFESVSFDSNSTLALNNAGCNVTFVAPWFENSGVSNAQYITQSTGQFTVTGGQMLDDNNTGTVAQHVTTTGGFFDIRGLMVFSGGQTVTNLVNNSGGGVGTVDWFAVSPTLDAPGTAATCATAYNCIVKRHSGAQPQLEVAVIDLVGAGAGAPAGVGGRGLFYYDGGANRTRVNDNNGGGSNVLTAASTDTLTNKTLTSPVINNSTGTGTLRSSLHVSDQGTACANGNIALSAGWGTTATATAAAGQGQTCQWTLTSSGTGQAASPTITWTLPTALPSASVVCSGIMAGGTQAFTSINQTTLSATAPIFTFNGTPVAGNTVFVVLRCGP